MAMVTANMPRPTEVVGIDPRALLGEDEKEQEAAKSFDPTTGLPRSIRAYVVVRDPRMTVVPHFFSEPECDHLIKLVEGYWMPSLVGQATYSTDEDYGKGNLENAMSNTRTSWSCMMRYSQTAVVERLEHRVASLAGLPTDRMERMNMVRYAPGEIFDEHHDGKFRPMTVFVYLNELPEDEEGGDTFFPYLGLSFKPRRGTAVMWANVEAGSDVEDSRMLHLARGPQRGVKYGVNCFLNVRNMRQIHAAVSEYELDQAAVVDLAELGSSRGSGAAAAAAAGSDAEASGEGETCAEEPKLTAFRLCADPKILTMPGLVSAAEVEHLLGLLGGASAGGSGAPQAAASDDPYREGCRTLRHIAAAETPTVEAVEKRLAGLGSMSLEYLAPLRIVRPSRNAGLCNRGCGPKSAYVCLAAEGEELFFLRLGMRLLLRPGDAVLWPNVDWETGTAVEDLRTLRSHRRRAATEGAASSSASDAPPLLGLDVFFHDNPLREQQRERRFVSDSEAEAAVKAADAAEAAAAGGAATE